MPAQIVSQFHNFFHCQMLFDFVLFFLFIVSCFIVLLAFNFYAFLNVYRVMYYHNQLFKGYWGILL